MAASVAPAVEARLAAHIAGALSADTPDDVLLRARCHLLDTLAAILSGRSLPAGQFARRFASLHGHGAGATLLGGDQRCDGEMAAFANAMAAHADETDDSHVWGRFHPGCAIVPAALAVAEEQGASSAQLLKAIALGYDVGARSTMALGYASPKSTVFSTHSIAALFGASATCGALLRLSAAEAEALLSFTVQQASGLSYWNRDPDHVEKSFDFGAKAARNGVFAARLAQAGMTAPDAPLTGENGYLAAYAEAPNAGALVDGLGERFEISRASIKKWSVGSPIQSVLDAVEALFEGAPVAPELIRSIEVRLPSNRIHVIDDRDMPAVCCQHLVALALRDGRVSFASSHDAAQMRDPVILTYRSKITLTPDDALAEAKPERQAIVTARMANGAERRHHARIVRGTADDPMTPTEVAAKAQDIVGARLPDQGRALIELCLERDFTVDALIGACRLRGGIEDDAPPPRSGRLR